MFAARYALSPYITHMRFVFKMLNKLVTVPTILETLQNTYIYILLGLSLFVKGPGFK